MQDGSLLFHKSYWLKDPAPAIPFAPTNNYRDPIQRWKYDRGSSLANWLKILFQQIDGNKAKGPISKRVLHFLNVRFPKFSFFGKFGVLFSCNTLSEMRPFTLLSTKCASFNVRILPEIISSINKSYKLTSIAFHILFSLPHAIWTNECNINVT